MMPNVLRVERTRMSMNFFSKAHEAVSSPVLGNREKLCLKREMRGEKRGNGKFFDLTINII